MAAFGIHELRKQTAEEFPDAELQRRLRRAPATRSSARSRAPTSASASASRPPKLRRPRPDARGAGEAPTAEADERWRQRRGRRLERLERLGRCARRASSPTRSSPPSDARPRCAEQGRWRITRRGVRGREGAACSSGAAPPRERRARRRVRTGNLPITNQVLSQVELGGRDRTGNLLITNQVLSQVELGGRVPNVSMDAASVSEPGGVLTEAIEAAYGTTYDVRWVYDQAEVSARLADGRYVSCVAETPAGELLCHVGMSLAAAGDAVAPLGPGGDAAGGARAAPLHPHQALPDGLGAGRGAGRDVQRGDRRPPLQPAGQHRARGARDRLPARLDPGLGRQRRRRRERRGGGSRRRSSTRSSTTATSARVYAPSATTRSSARRWRCASCAARWPSRRPTPSWPSRTELHVEVDEDHNLALITVRVPGADLEPVVAAERHHLFHRRGLDAIYIDLPLERRRRRWSPTTSSGSGSPTPASSPTTAPTATCCGCSRCTGSESRPTTSPSPRTTGANCSTTSSPTCRSAA